MPAKKTPSPSVYELKITLREILPPIWRRVRVPAGVSLRRVHHVFQIAMGWTDSHLHEFEQDGARYGIPDSDGFDLDIIDDSRVSLDSVLKAAGDSLLYVYDLGDDWRHDVVLEKILPGGAGAARPECLAGQRHCPPEDVGGTPGYEQFLEVIFDPAHEDHAHMVGWAGGRFQAEQFNLAAVNRSLSRLRWPAPRGG